MLQEKKHKDVIWYDFLEPTEEEFLPVAEKYGINKYITKKFLSFTNRDKALILGDYMFLSISFPNLKEENYEKQSIKFIIGKKVIFTAQEVQNEGLANFSKIFELNANFEKSDTNDNCGAFAFLHMIEKIYENAIYELEEVRDEIDQIEDKIFKGQEKRMVKRISITNRKLLDFRKNLRSHNETWEIFLELAEEFFVRKDTKMALQSITLSSEKTMNEALQLKELLLELRNTNNSLLYYNQGQVMKNFTTISFLTLPITLFLSLVSVPMQQYFLGYRLEHEIIIIISVILFIISLFVSKLMKWW